MSGGRQQQQPFPTSVISRAETVTGPGGDSFHKQPWQTFLLLFSHSFSCCSSNDWLQQQLQQTFSFLFKLYQTVCVCVYVCVCLSNWAVPTAAAAALFVRSLIRSSCSVFCCSILMFCVWPAAPEYNQLCRFILPESHLLVPVFVLFPLLHTQMHHFSALAYCVTAIIFSCLVVGGWKKNECFPFIHSLYGNCSSTNANERKSATSGNCRNR